MFGQRHISGRIACGFQFAGGEDHFFELGPTQKIAVVYPLGDHPDAAHNAGTIRVDLARPGGDVICPAGADRLNRGDDRLFLLIADTLYRFVHFLRSRGATAGGIDTQDDRLDR